jgi:hypothetical protein
MMKWRKRRIFPLYIYYASLDFFANSLVLIFSIPLDKRNDSNCILLLNNSIKEYKTHSVAYTGSYAVILLYNILLVHNAMTVSQGPLLSRYLSMWRPTLLIHNLDSWLSQRRDMGFANWTWIELTNWKKSFETDCGWLKYVYLNTHV